MQRSTILSIVLVALGSAAPCLGQDTPPPAPPPVLNDHQLLHKYVWSTLGPDGALHATLASALEQWRGAPDDWSIDNAGYARRWASEFAEEAIGSTTKYAVAHLLRHDPSFARCECTGVGPRLRHAIRAPFMARAQDGRWVFSPATVAGLVAENVVPAATWYPEPHGTRDGLAHAGTGVLSKMGVNIFREFVYFHRKRPGR